MNKKFLFIGIFYVIFSIIFFLLTFGRASDVCFQVREISPSVPSFEYSNLLDAAAGFVCALRYVFLAFSIIALAVGVFCIIRAFKKKVENKK